MEELQPAVPILPLDQVSALRHGHCHERSPWPRTIPFRMPLFSAFCAENSEFHINSNSDGIEGPLLMAYSNCIMKEFIAKKFESAVLIFGKLL